MPHSNPEEDGKTGRGGWKSIDIQLLNLRLLISKSLKSKVEGTRPRGLEYSLK